MVFTNEIKTDCSLLKFMDYDKLTSYAFSIQFLQQAQDNFLATMLWEKKYFTTARHTNLAATAEFQEYQQTSWKFHQE